MNSKLRVGVASGLTLAATGVVLTTTSASSSPSGKHDRGSAEVLRVVVKEVSEQYLDLGAPDFSEGDQFIFTNDLYSGDRKIGEDGGVCVVTRLTQEGAATLACNGVNTLPGGQVAVQGLVTYGPEEEFKADPYHVAITGGTGKYRKARGTVRIQETAGHEYPVVFRIHD